MAIKITTDSTCDLTAEQLEAYQIEVLPLYIIKGGIPFRDSVDITPEDIYRHVSGGGEITTTAALNVEDYQSCFSRFSPEFEAVIHINLGSGFSSCYQNALIAAQEYPNVYVVDSCSLSSGHGQVVLEAVSLVQQGLQPSDIIARLKSFPDRVDASFLLNQLDYLSKGGRCSSIAALGANLLKLKPCIEVCGGRMKVGKKYRGAFEKALLEYTRDRLMGRQDVNADRVLVVHAGCPSEYVELVCKEVEQYTGKPPLAQPPAGCTIASHCGPCTLGIMFARK